VPGADLRHARQVPRPQLGAGSHRLEVGLEAHLLIDLDEDELVASEAIAGLRQLDRLDVHGTRCGANAGITSRATSSTERIASAPLTPGTCIQQISSVAPSSSR